MKNFRSLLFVVIILFTYSCTKFSEKVYKSEFEKLAFETLRMKMNISDFSTLDWNTIKVFSINGEPSLMKIKSKNNPLQFLLFAKLNNETIHNWVEFKNYDKTNDRITGLLVLKELNNSVINQFEVKENQIIFPNSSINKLSSLSINSTADEEVVIELPPVVVVGYIYNQSINYWSLYWLFNMDSNWYNQFAQIDLLGFGDINGSGQVIPISDLYPETAEILEFELDYKNQMSDEEINIFESMTREQQLKYLWNAYNAKTLAQKLFPNSLFNGKGDAFRHAYFSALNSESLGVELAKRLGDAHENIPAPNLLEREMDLRNNQIGRDLFRYLQQQGLAGHFYRESVLIRLNIMMGNGDLWHLRPLAFDGSVIPGVTELVNVNQ